MVGFDGTNAQFISVNASGELQVGLSAAVAAADALANPTASGVISFSMGFNGTTWDRVDAVDTGALVTEVCDSGTGNSLCADVQTAGADGVANTENGLWTYSVLMGFNGTTFDRLDIDAADNLMVSLGTALDSTNDSIAAVSQFIDGGTGFTQETSRPFVVGGVFDDTAGTALAENDLAAGRISATRAFVHVLEGATTRGLFAEVLTAGADAEVNTDNALVTIGWGMLFNGTTWDRADGVDTGAAVTEVCDSGTGSTLCADVETAGADDLVNTENGLLGYMNVQAFDGTTWDRLRSYANNADSVTSPTLGSLGVTGFNFVYDTSGGNWDRETVTMATGAYIPGTNINLAAATTETCTTDNVLTVGTVYLIQTESTVFCELGADAATIVSATTDTPLFNPVQYRWLASSTSFDTACCISASGTIAVDITPLTF